MSSLAKRLKELETKNRIDIPVMVINKGLDQLTPGEQTLFENVRFVFIGTQGISIDEYTKTWSSGNKSR